MYRLLLSKLKEVELLQGTESLSEDSVNELTDLLADLNNLKFLLLSRFDQYIKFQLQRRGITVIQNTYTGFDTEYQLSDPRKFKNKMISAQIALQRRTILKIPLYTPQDISYVHPLDSTLSNIYKNKVDINGSGFDYCFVDESKTCSYPTGNKESKVLNEMLVLNNSLKFSISNVRESISLQSLIDVNNSIIDKLKNLEGVDFFEDNNHDQVVFIFPLTPMFTDIKFVDEFTFKELLDWSREDFSSTPSDSGNFSPLDSHLIKHPKSNSFRGGSSPSPAPSLVASPPSPEALSEPLSEPLSDVVALSDVVPPVRMETVRVESESFDPVSIEPVRVDAGLLTEECGSSLSLCGQVTEAAQGICKSEAAQGICKSERGKLSTSEGVVVKTACKELNTSERVHYNNELPSFGTSLSTDFQGLVHILTTLGLTSDPLKILN